MKLYLSSIDIPSPRDLELLASKPLSGMRAILIPNAQDYYSERARSFKISTREAAMKKLGMHVTTVDLRQYENAASLLDAMRDSDLVWAMGGNTFCLLYEMRRSGFDGAIRELLGEGVVYGGDSAGALVAGTSIGGIESADEPEFAEEVLTDGLNLVPFVVLPHSDNPTFGDAAREVRNRTPKGQLIELTDKQAVIFEDSRHRLITLA